MNTRTASISVAGSLPAQKIDASGIARVDQRAVLALALPLMANSAIQIVLNLTDMWFIGHISTAALAGVAAVQWLVLVVVLTLGGTASSIQTLAAQAYGSRRYARASRAVWIGLWATLCAAPLFVLVGAAGPLMLEPFGLGPGVNSLASAFWLPRVGGATFGVAVWGMLGFYNGIGRPRITLAITIATTVANAALNYLFIFHLHWGVAGSGWATTGAQALGLALSLVIFMRQPFKSQYKSNLTWHPHWKPLRQQLKLGLPTGLLPAADLLGISIFQMMQVRLGTVDGAATQMAMMLTSIAYMPGYGLASSGTTLVGQSIGAGDKDWATKVGNTTIKLAVGYMGLVTIFLAVIGPWLIPLFVNAADPHASNVIALGRTLLWFAAGYQIFDGLNLGAGFCLRGAGDMRVPTLTIVFLSWFGFVPFTHMFTFAPGHGWVEFLPQFGYGAIGGWAVALVYCVVLGSFIYLRWRSGAWRKIKLR